jgi:LacI family transcriptional regulator
LSQHVKLEDVARLAGVSAKTVSRVVNGEANVSESTKQAVDRAISALGYKPNLAARSLAASRSFLIGIISPTVDNFYSYFHALHNGAIRACRERGLHLVAEEMDFDTRGSLQRLEGSLRQMRYDGVIVTHPANKNKHVLDLLEHMKIRYVRIGPVSDLHRSDSVSPDETQGLQQLAEHLVSLGHRHIAIAYVEARRRNLLRDSLVKAGADLRHLQFVSLSAAQDPITAGRELASGILALPQRPTAVFTYADDAAAGLIGYAWEHGLNIPRDLSVVGYDDGQVAQAVWPPLTTIREPLDEMARAAVSLLLDPAKDGNARRIVLPVKFIVRSSTAVPSR